MNESFSRSTSASTSAFLGVERSVRGQRWVKRSTLEQEALALAMVQSLGLPDMLARVLAGRGVLPDEAERFLEPKLRDLMPDPDCLTGMREAVARLKQAIEAGESVAIFGDYDVDGACSAALLAQFLTSCGLTARIHIPDRISEGYGPNVAAIRALRDEGATLLVTVDCGTTSFEPLAEARVLGLDVIVLDHHQAGETLPEAVTIVNPNRQDDLSGLGYVCAAGVVFLTLVALNRALREAGFWQGRESPDLMALLDLTALATVADVVPLIGLNRAFVRQGLAVMRGRGRPGLAALMDVARLKSAPEAWHLGFLLGPRINAGGRIGDAALGAKLLLTGDSLRAATIAEELESLNRERQAIELVSVQEAEAQVWRILEETPDAPLLTTFSPDWHPGVVGLIASRLKETFRRPAFAFALNGEGLATGSGRSVPGTDIGKLVRHAVEQGAAQKGGGHAMAAGVTVVASDIARFVECLIDAMPVSGTETEAHDLMLDGLLTATGAQASLVSVLNRAGPFGAGHPEPVFAFASHRLIEARSVGGNGHVRFKLRSGDGTTLGGIAFRAEGKEIGQTLAKGIGSPIHAAGTLSIDSWGGSDRADLRLVDIALPE